MCNATWTSLPAGILVRASNARRRWRSSFSHLADPSAISRPVVFTRSVAVCHRHQLNTHVYPRSFHLDSELGQLVRHGAPLRVNSHFRDAEGTVAAEYKQPGGTEISDASNSNGLGILKFLEGKTFFITGATGFLAKVLVEKILREQPRTKHIYLLIQPTKNESSAGRLASQMENSPVFQTLRDQHQHGFKEFIASKVTAVAGNIQLDNLGMDPETLATLQEEVDVVVNSAASTKFDERYDTAVQVNTLGPGRVLRFAQTCRNAQLLVHYSTAFVNGRRVGNSLERIFKPGDSIAQELNGDGAAALDLDSEIANALTAAETLRRDDPAKAELAIEKEIQTLGTKRANLFGWQDTYVFTKALGEMVLWRERGSLPVVVVRPSIVESAMSEPLEGWIEGNRMADPVMLAYGKGMVRGFCGDPNGILDLVPVDFVVNATLAAMASHACRDALKVFHVATSTVNPLTLRALRDIVQDHFERRPMVDRKGNSINVKPAVLFTTEFAFVAHIWVRYALPLALLKFLQWLFPWMMTYVRRQQLRMMDKTYASLKRFAKLYRPYTFYGGLFDAGNTEELLSGLSLKEREAFDFDLRSINWLQYIGVAHLSGLRKYVLKGRSRG